MVTCHIPVGGPTQSLRLEEDDDIIESDDVIDDGDHGPSSMPAAE